VGVLPFEFEFVYSSDFASCFIYGIANDVIFLKATDHKKYKEL
jgi:hypothetical protein